MHNTVNMVTIGVAYTGQHLPGPDVMLLAQPATHCVASASDDSDTQRTDFKASESLELTRQVQEFESLCVGCVQSGYAHHCLAAGQNQRGQYLAQGQEDSWGYMAASLTWQSGE